jgi:hypothetical protein
MAHSWHEARRRNSKQSRTKNPKPTFRVQDRPKPPQSRLGKTAHRGPASGSHRARPTQERVAPCRSSAKLPELPRDESGPREAKPASLHRLVSQVAEQRRAPRRPKDSNNIGRAEDTCRYAHRLEAYRAAATNRGVRAAPPAKDAAARWMTETSPTMSQRGNIDITSPRASCRRGGGTPRGSGEQ